MGKITAAITGVGEYLPDYILTNEELSTMVDTSDEWIMSHIGVKTRHILKGEGVGSSYMGARAVINLLDKAGVDPMEIDLVICATVTPDMFFPSTGNLIADQAGCKNAFAYDVSAACSGFLFALTEHGHANGLARAFRHHDGAADSLVRLAGVDAELDGHVDGFVELGVGAGLHSVKRFVQSEGLGEVVLAEEFLAALGNLSHYYRPSTVMPMERAEPAIVRTAASRSAAVRSGSFILAISSA